jgi:hypothetical protein
MLCRQDRLLIRRAAEPQGGETVQAFRTATTALVTMDVARRRVFTPAGRVDDAARVHRADAGHTARRKGPHGVAGLQLPEKGDYNQENDLDAVRYVVSVADDERSSAGLAARGETVNGRGCSRR